MARAPASVIICRAGQAPIRWRPLSSNVRQHTEAMMVLAISAGAAVAAKDPMPLRPRLVGHSKQTQRPRSSATVAASSTQHVGSDSRQRIQTSRTAAQVSQFMGPPGGGCSCLRSSLVGQDTDTTACSGLRSRRVCGQYQVHGLCGIGLRHHVVRPQQCCLTLRSSGPPPDWHLARAPASVIICRAGQAPIRRRPLSSNVRPRNRHTRDTLSQG